jgi:REP element-mobilizing transposase RayT
MELTANSNDTYFVTLTVVEWIDVFTRRFYKDYIIENLEYCRKNKGLEIYSYVIMSNHLHLILKSKEKPLSDTLRDFKTYTSKELFKMIKENPKESRKEWMISLMKQAGKNNMLNKSHQFWQNDNQPIKIWDIMQFKIKENYIHQNPVLGGFVARAQDFLYSSASKHSPLIVDIY